MSLRRFVAPASGPIHEDVGADALHPLDPTEYNLERLNARARGAGTTYCIVELRGAFHGDALARAVDAMTDRHPMLRVRIARGSDGGLFFAPTRGDRADGTARVPIERRRVADPHRWIAEVEDDANAGAIDSARGPLFAVAVLEPEDLADGREGPRTLVLIAHHAVSDAVSLLALAGELFVTMTTPRPWPPLPPRPLRSPFTETSETTSIDDATLERLESLERTLLAARDPHGGYAADLMKVHAAIDRAGAEREPSVGVGPEVDLGVSAERYERARTVLVRERLTERHTLALQRLAREHGLTLNAALGAALVFALVERHRGLTNVAAPGDPPIFALANAVNLRRQLVPPLDTNDVRMAVDVAFAKVPARDGARFWDLARETGDQVRRAVDNRRALSSYFRTERRDFGIAPPGVRFPVLSNVGRIPLAASYGDLRVEDVAIAMTNHGSFQIGLLASTFADRTGLTFYFETPTISRPSMDRFVATVMRVLAEAAEGREPTLP